MTANGPKRRYRRGVLTSEAQSRREADIANPTDAFDPLQKCWSSRFSSRNCRSLSVSRLLGERLISGHLTKTHILQRGRRRKGAAALLVPAAPIPSRCP